MLHTLPYGGNVMTDSARIPVSDHLARPWRVHALAPDFELLDVWRFPVRVAADERAAFEATMSDARAVKLSGPARALFGLRLALGKLFRWDRERVPLPIPGCRERSIAARLPGGADVIDARSETKFHPVYADERERLLEISNGTMHGLMHLGWIALDDGTFAPQMAVYVKHRGPLGRLYMALISPFRHLVVYPAMMRAVATRWAASAAGGSPRAILRHG
jgi:hypothetical protein